MIMSCKIVFISLLLLLLTSHGDGTWLGIMYVFSDSMVYVCNVAVRCFSCTKT